MQDGTRVSKPSVHRHKKTRQNRAEDDDEYSSDSGCSSRGSSVSNERLSRRESAERTWSSANSVASVHRQCHIHRSRHVPSATRSQERLPSTSSAENRSTRSKSSRSWSPSDDRAFQHGHRNNNNNHNINRHINRNSHSQSPSPSDAQSSDSDSFKRPSGTEVIRLLWLKITRWQDNCNSSSNSSKENKQSKKSPRRILRDPVAYTYLHGPSGLPTKRVPRKTIQQTMMPCVCHDTIGLYR